MTNATKLSVVVLLAGALAFAGCGDDDSSGDSGSGAAETVKLSATEFEFTPSSPSVEDPGEVTFEVTNDGKFDHALEVEGPNSEAETDTIPAGQSASLTVNLSEAGDYEMYCPIGNHRDEGMEGTVSVAGGGGDTTDAEGGRGAY